MKKVVIVFLIVCCLCLTGCSVKKVDELTDAEKFSKEFNISVENKFVYASIDEVLDILDNGTAIILFADSDDEKSLKAVSIISEQAKKDSVEEIYYFNPKVSKEKQTKEHKRLSSIVEDMIDDSFSIPSLYAIKEGQLINYSDCFSSEEELSEEYLTNKKLKKIREEYSSVLTYQLREE